ncbi:hypothetical protein ACQ86N_41945 [Puia sp. P3]
MTVTAFPSGVTLHGPQVTGGRPEAEELPAALWVASSGEESQVE